tara:strand:- start:337 stop:981 length:645 start_codon:yes stop_codon:yes gene_type:complete
MNTNPKKARAGGFRFNQADIGVFNSGSILPIADKVRRNDRVIGLTNGEFSLIDLIAGLLEVTGKAHLVVATWSAGIKDCHQVKWLMDTGKLASVRVITDHSFCTRKKQYMVSISDMFGDENIRTTESHAKFVLIHNDDFRIVIRTSMNLNANKTCETFEVDKDAGVFELFWEWCQHNFDDMPEGFTASSWKASKSLKKYFTRESVTKYTGWSDL